MARRYTHEEKFYIAKEQKHGLDLMSAETGKPRSEIMRDLLANAIAMTYSECAICADGQQCIAPIIRNQTGKAIEKTTA